MSVNGRYLINDSPILPLHSPSTHSSVLYSCKFRYPSNAIRMPLYSIPHFNFTMTGLSIKSIKKGLGFTGMGYIKGRDQEGGLTYAVLIFVTNVYNLIIIYI
jgi:hypothetical protein